MLITMLLSIWPLCVPLLSIAFPLISSNITCSWPGAIFLHRFQVMLQFGQYSALWQFVLPFDPYCRLCGYSCFSGLYCSTLALLDHAMKVVERIFEHRIRQQIKIDDMQKLLKIGRVVLEICLWTDRQTDMHITILRYPDWGRVNDEMLTR